MLEGKTYQPSNCEVCIDNFKVASSENPSDARLCARANHLHWVKGLLAHRRRLPSSSGADPQALWASTSEMDSFCSGSWCEDLRSLSVGPPILKSYKRGRSGDRSESGDSIRVNVNSPERKRKSSIVDSDSHLLTPSPVVIQLDSISQPSPHASSSASPVPPQDLISQDINQAISKRFESLFAKYEASMMEKVANLGNYSGCSSQLTGFSNPVLHPRAPPSPWNFPESQGPNPTMFDPQFYGEFSGQNEEDFTFTSLFNPVSTINTLTSIVPAVIAPLNSMPVVLVSSASTQNSSVPSVQEPLSFVRDQV